jgi:hypothetical protein
MAIFNHQLFVIREITPVMTLRLLFLMSGALLPYASQAQFNTNQKRWDFYLALTAEYSPNGNEILQGINSDFDKWVEYADEATTTDGLIENSGTVIHEGLHGYEWEIEENYYGKTGYFIAPGSTILVPDLDIFNSNELNRQVPKEQQEKIFRYSSYVGDKTGLSSQVDGILGMLGEFSAYYHSGLFTMQTRPWLEKNIGYGDPSEWSSMYFNNLGNSVVAFNEFRLFMAWYLAYARKNHPEQYRAIMGNTNFRIAFTLLHREFKSLADQYENEVNDVISKFNEAGNDVRIEGEFFMVYNESGGASGSGIFLEEINYLKSLWTPELAKELRELSMPEVTIGNYSSYLEDESE